MPTQYVSQEVVCKIVVQISIVLKQEIQQQAKLQSPENVAMK